jgi:acetylornithine/succinyldiaminopimelate/putrescine aminotransferase
MKNGSRFWNDPAVQSYASHVNPAFVKLLNALGYGRVYTRAKGVHVWDIEGCVYLDCLAGFGSANIGHNHPRLMAKLVETLQSNPYCICHTGVSEPQARLAKKLSDLSGLDFALFSNSGAEAVDAALKVAQAATGRNHFIYCERGYHGNTLSTLPLMGAPRLRRVFEPLPERFTKIPFNDCAALEQALEKNPCAGFVVEGIQSEGGVRIPAKNYLREAKRLCKKRGTLLIVDEIQTGLGRTGKWFSFQRNGATPDIVTLAKALSGGIVPVAATLVEKKCYLSAYGKQNRFDLHSSTFAGNALSAAAALETLNIIEEERLVERAEKLGEKLKTKLEESLRGQPLVKEIRGEGLLIGIEIESAGKSFTQKLLPCGMTRTACEIIGQWIALRLLEKGIICQPAAIAWNTLKIEPPLTIEEEHIDEIVAALKQTLDECQSLPATLTAVAKRFVAQKCK